MLPSWQPNALFWSVVRCCFGSSPHCFLRCLPWYRCIVLPGGIKGECPNRAQHDRRAAKKTQIGECRNPVLYIACCCGEYAKWRLPEDSMSYRTKAIVIPKD